MLKRIITWIKSCFAGDAAISEKAKAQLDIELADQKARNRVGRGSLNG